MGRVASAGSEVLIVVMSGFLSGGAALRVAYHTGSVSSLAALVLLPAFAIPAATPAGARAVSRSEILAAMRNRRGYDLTATTNGARFQAEVLLDLLRASRARDPYVTPLFIGHVEWFAAYLERTGLGAESAPLFMRLAHEYGQDLEVDARADRVIEKVVEGPAPLLAANVTIGWPPSDGKGSRYSYEDTLSVPDLKVTNERVITYHLLDCGDFVAYDEIEGLLGRPTEGFLGLLFNLIGEGTVHWSRMTIASDGLQVSRTRAGKGPFNVETSITVFPDGRVEKDLPPGRSDLVSLEKKLLLPRKVRYRPLDRDRAPAERGAGTSQ